MENWLLLGQLRRAVNKIKLLLSFDIRRWMLVVSSSKRLPSFSDRPGLRARLPSFSDRPGLRACIDENDPFSESEDMISLSRGRLHRTTSYPSKDDVNKRADLFIANFYERLQLERQVSLELRYCWGNSFESRSPR